MAALLLLSARPSINEAFSPPPSSLIMGPYQFMSRALGAFDNVAEAPTDVLLPDLMYEQLPGSDCAVASSLISPSESSDATSTIIMQTPSAIQSRTLDRDAVTNTAFFAFAIVLVLERVLSVDVGITRGWTAAEIAERIPLDNWRSYTNILNMAPLQTKAVTSATVYAIGDVIAQRKEGTDIGRLDRWRTVRSLTAGLIGHGPMSHVWYHVSEDFFDNVVKLHAWWDFVPKVVVDQTVFGPIWNNSYILLLGLMQLHKPSQIWSDMKRTTIPLIVSGLKLWPFVHCITYGLIPVENRLLWVDAVEIVWVTILASVASSSGSEASDVGGEGDSDVQKWNEGAVTPDQGSGGSVR